MPMLRLLLLAACLVVIVPLALAEEPPPEKVSITLRPAQPPRPSLQHRLYPETLELRPGNAATLYNKALLLLPSDKEGKDLLNQASAWSDMPLGQLPRDEIKKLLQRCQSSLSQVELAVLREACDWGLPLRESENPFMILLPEVQEIRNLARVLIVRARLEMAEQKLERALATLRTTIVLARHVSQAPTLINALVGMAVLGMVDKALQEFISQPDAPSIYWAVTTLPNPLFDLNRAMELDANSIYLLFPELYAARRRPLSDDEWKVLHEKVTSKMVRLSGDLQAMSSGPNPLDLAAQAVRAVQAMAGVKPRLVEFGFKQDELDAMPVAKLVLLHDMLVYEDYRDELFKWFSVPYHQIGDGLDRFERRLKEGPSTIVVVSPQLLLPALKSIRAAEARTARRLAALRVLDGLRLHAGAHEGQMPEKLNEVTLVPLPDNPATGRPFEYALANGEATLLAAGPNPVEYRIRPAK